MRPGIGRRRVPVGNDFPRSAVQGKALAVRIARDVRLPAVGAGGVVRGNRARDLDQIVRSGRRRRDLDFGRAGAFEASGIFKRVRAIRVIGVQISPLPDQAVSRYDRLRLGRRRVRGVE